MKEFAEKNIQWLGHDTFKVTGSKIVYIDPYKIERSDVADIVCITHDHFDHCVPEDIAKVQGPNTTIVAPKDCLAKLEGKRQALGVGEKVTIDGVEIEAVPAYNTNKEFHPRANDWLGFIITIDGVRIYHAGDTDHIPEMKSIRADIALLPVSGTYVMTAEEAVLAALDIKPGLAIPMHYGAIVGDSSDAQRFSKALAGKVDVLIKQRV